MQRLGRRPLRAALAVSVTAVAAVALAPLPAFGDSDTGTVNATVTVAAPCILLDITDVDFGTKSFNTASSNIFSQSTTLHATNCSGTDENILARGTDATNTAGTATWTLNSVITNPCTIGPNTYLLTHDNLGSGIGTALTTSDQEVATGITAGEQYAYKLTLLMPCTGSDGAGETMNLQSILTATF